MRKITAICLVLSFLFCFVSCSLDRSDIYIATDTETLTAEETTEKVLVNDNNGISFLSVFLGNKYLNKVSDRNYKQLSTVEYNILYLSDEDRIKYPRLADALDELNNETAEIYQQTFEELTEFAEYSFEDGSLNSPYTSSEKYYLQRADNVILSFSSHWSEYSGGAHPQSAVSGSNYDPVSGDELSVTDVITDITRLPSIITNIIIENTDNEEQFAHLEEFLSGYSADDFSWTLGYHGITFLFSPYEIAPYGAGRFNATIYFDEYPELFYEKYTVTPNSYVIALPESNDVVCDLNPSDGKKDLISVKRSGEEEAAYTQLAITVNEKEYKIDNLEYFYIEPYLVNADGKHFIYVEYSCFGDYSYIAFYSVDDSGVKEVGELEASSFKTEYFENENGEIGYKDLIFNDPTDFVVETRFDLASTFRGRKTYFVNPHNGMPESNDIEYEIYGQMNNVTSKQDISVEILPDLKKETVPAGTEFEFLRTDGESYIDAKISDGRECRFSVTKNAETYEVYVDGKSEYEVFEGISYGQ